MSSNSARRSAVQAITTYKPEASPLNFYDTKPTDIFGCNVFTDKVMRERLPKDVYKALHKTIEFGERMDPGIADTVAAVMKDWGHRKGCHPLHPYLLPPDRSDGGKARQLPDA